MFDTLRLDLLRLSPVSSPVIGRLLPATTRPCAWRRLLSDWIREGDEEPQTTICSSRLAYAPLLPLVGYMQGGV